jgi:glycosyltransferase involved in cell wall biosynthesis
MFLTDNNCAPRYTGFNDRELDEPCDCEAPEISVVIPARDEELTIGECIAGIQSLFAGNNIKGEIIVSDSSTDRTAAIATDLGATVVHPVKMGYGFAYLEGFRYVNSDVIVMMDADGTYDSSELLRLVKPLNTGADLVIGSRFKGTISPGSMTPLHRYIGNPLLTGVLNFVFKTHFSDAHSGFRAIKTEALNILELKSGGMELASEMLIMASKKGLAIEEIPISYYPRITPSKLHSFADGWRHLRFVLLMDPLPFLTIPGLLFAVLGLFLMAIFYISGDIETSHLHSFILGAVLLIGGIQLFFMGITTNVYSMVHGYKEKVGLTKKFLDYHSLEKFLIAGGVFIFAGFLLGLSIIYDWISAKFGEISQISTSVVALSMIIIGIQLIFCSIFISMMLLNDGEVH